MARWLSPTQTPQAEWLWVQSTAKGAIVPLIVVTAAMVPAILNNGGINTAVTSIQADMAAPDVMVSTGLDAAPLLTATSIIPAPALGLTEAPPRATATAKMVVPIVSKTVVCFPRAATLTLTGKPPALPVGSGKFPPAAALTLAGKVPGVSSVTPTVVTPTAASFTISGHAPTFPTGPRFGNYTFPITLS